MKPEASIAQSRVTAPVFGSERVPVNLTDSPRVHVEEFVIKVNVGVVKTETVTVTVLDVAELDVASPGQTTLNWYVPGSVKNVSRM